MGIQVKIHEKNNANVCKLQVGEEDILGLEAPGLAPKSRVKECESEARRGEKKRSGEIRETLMSKVCASANEALKDLENELPGRVSRRIISRGPPDFEG